MTPLHHFKDNAEIDSYFLSMLVGAGKIKAACIVFALIVLAGLGLVGVLGELPW